jgi:Polysaccharide lyase
MKSGVLSSPAIAMEINKTNWRLGGVYGTSQLPTAGNFATITLGAWTQFIVGIKFSTSSATGWVNVLMNGEEKIAKRSLITMNTSGGHPDPVYLKQGIYRTKVWAATHILHFGPMVIARSKVDVDAKLAELYGA